MVNTALSAEKKLFIAVRVLLNALNAVGVLIRRMVKMAEMTAFEYLKQRGRMTNNCDISCSVCPLADVNNSKEVCCEEIEGKYPEEAIAIVQKWAEEHPQKTMLQDFLEKHPNAPIESDGTPEFCPESLGYKHDHEICDSSDDNRCTKCWNRPLEE